MCSHQSEQKVVQLQSIVVTQVLQYFVLVYYMKYISLVDVMWQNVKQCKGCEYFS